MSTALPRRGPATLNELRRFDLRHGVPAAIGVLRRRLLPGELGRVLVAMARGALRDPLRGLRAAPGGFDATADALTRHQLRAAMRLDDALRHALRGPRWPAERRQTLLVDVIAESGAAFIRENVPFPTAEAWRGAQDGERRAFLEQLRGRLFNARFEPAEIREDEVGFDVRACRFVQLTRAAGRPELAAAFCEADSRFFERHEDLIQLRRTETIARGGDRCDFRFRLQPGQTEAKVRP